MCRMAAKATAVEPSKPSELSVEFTAPHADTKEWDDVKKAMGVAKLKSAKLKPAEFVVMNVRTGESHVVDGEDPVVQKEADDYLQKQLELTARARANYESKKASLPKDSENKWLVFFPDAERPYLAESTQRVLDAVDEACYCTFHAAPALIVDTSPPVESLPTV